MKTIDTRDEDALEYGDDMAWRDVESRKPFTGLVLTHNTQGEIDGIESVKDGHGWGPQVTLGPNMELAGVSFVVSNWLMGLSVDWNTQQRRAKFTFEWGGKSILSQDWSWDERGRVTATEKHCDREFMDGQLSAYRNAT